MRRGKGMKFVGDSRVPDEPKTEFAEGLFGISGKTEAFYPDFLLQEWMVGAVFLIGFLCLTVAHPAPLEAIADPFQMLHFRLQNWYFLFLYQLLKYEFATVYVSEFLLASNTRSLDYVRLAPHFRSG